MDWFKGNPTRKIPSSGHPYFAALPAEGTHLTTDALNVRASWWRRNAKAQGSPSWRANWTQRCLTRHCSEWSFLKTCENKWLEEPTESLRCQTSQGTSTSWYLGLSPHLLAVHQIIITFILVLALNNQLHCPQRELNPSDTKVPCAKWHSGLHAWGTMKARSRGQLWSDLQHLAMATEAILNSNLKPHHESSVQWIDLRANVSETVDFPIK